MSIFFKRRYIWLPTFWGGIIIAAALALSTAIILKNIAHFLAENEPIAAHYLIVEGWQEESAILQALDTFNNGHYKLLITTGGRNDRLVNPEYNNYAEQAAGILRSHGIDSNKLIAIPTPASAQNRTFLSAVMVRDWLNSNNVTNISLNIFTSHVHSRRTHKLYKMAFGKTLGLGIFAADPTGFDLNNWWKTSEGAKSVLTESIGLIWTYCCFSPGEYGSHQEKWGLIK